MIDKCQQAQLIANYAVERGISRLVHFTPFLNLLGIYSLGGIKSRDRVLEYATRYQEEDLMAYIAWNDTLRLDRRTDCINLSIQRMNVPLFTRFKREFPQGAPWCILEISTECLQKNGALFTVANAAATSVRYGGTAGGIDGLKAVFQDKIIVRKRYGVDTYTRGVGFPSNWPTCVQAEVLYPGEIDLKYITGLIFESSEDAARAKAMLELECCGRALPQIKILPEEFK